MGQACVGFVLLCKKTSASSRCVLAGKDLIGWRRRVIALLRGRKKALTSFFLQVCPVCFTKPVVAQEPCVPWRNKGKLRSEYQRTVEEDIDLFRRVVTTHSAQRTFQVYSRKYTPVTKIHLSRFVSNWEHSERFPYTIGSQR